MGEGARQRVSRANACLGGLLEDAKRALRGEAKFDTEEIEKIRGPLDEMSSIVAESAELRRLQPDLEGELDLYKAQLGELQTTLAEIRVMLLARQASLESGRAQLFAVSQWVAAFRQTK